MTHTAMEGVLQAQAAAKNASLAAADTAAQILMQASNVTEENIDYSTNDTSSSSAAWNESMSSIPTSVQFNEIRPIHIATTIMFCAGLIQIAMGFGRLHHLACYFSEQVMSGFIVGGCVHVFFAQLGAVLGVRLPLRSGPFYLYERLFDIWTAAPEFRWPALVISASSTLFLLATKEVLNPWFGDLFLFPIPYELLLVVIAITATNFAELAARHNIHVVGNIPTDFPPPALPRLDLLPQLALSSFSIAMTAVAIHITVAKVVEKRYDYKVDLNQELFALGFVGVLASFFPVFPVTSGFARSVIGAAVADSTQLTCLFSSLALLSVILYIGPALEYLPQSVLAVIIIVSLKSMLVKVTELKELWPAFKVDFTIWIVSFILTLVYDLAAGLALAIVFAALTTVVRSHWPRWYLLTRSEGDGVWRERTGGLEMKDDDGGGGGDDDDRFPAAGVPRLAVFRLHGPLIFTSCDRFALAVQSAVRHVRKSVQQRRQRSFLTIEELEAEAAAEQLENEDSKPKDGDGGKKEDCRLVIDCDSFPYIDYLGLATLKRTVRALHADAVIVALVVSRADLSALLETTRFYEHVDKQIVFASIDAAVSSLMWTRKSVSRSGGANGEEEEEEENEASYEEPCCSMCCRHRRQSSDDANRESSGSGASSSLRSRSSQAAQQQQF